MHGRTNQSRQPAGAPNGTGGQFGAAEITSVAPRTMPAMTAVTNLESGPVRPTLEQTVATLETVLPISTGKSGTDAPPLAVMIPGHGRYYVLNPNDVPFVEANFERALADGKAFPSVTNIISRLAATGGLKDYDSRIIADRVVNDLKTLRDGLTSDDAVVRDKALTALTALLEEDDKGKAVYWTVVKNTPEETRTAAADRGTDVHAIVEAIASGHEPEDVPEAAAGYVNAFRAFQETFPGMKVKYVEATVLNQEAGAVGTADAIVEYNGKHYIADYKTNNNATVYAKTGMQLAATANGEAILYADGRREPLPEIHGGIGIGLGPTGKHQVFFFETARDGENYAGFKALQQAWKWEREHRKAPRRIAQDDLDRLTNN